MSNGVDVKRAPEVLCERSGAAGVITLNRPQALNAITHDMVHDMRRALDGWAVDPAVTRIVVRGAGERAFSAGADISEFETYRATSDDSQTYNAATDTAQGALGSLSKPTIAMIRGACVGGGCGLAMSCDIRLADRSAKFAITPARLGLVYPVKITKRLVDLVGPAQAKLMLYTGRTIDAERAAALGLVDDLCDAATLEADTVALAETIAARAQYSVRGTKRIVDLISAGLSEENEETLSLRARAIDTADYREGVRAFLEKRPAVFGS
jgi:enoyl-CoA hydratase/carnithine racemase